MNLPEAILPLDPLSEFVIIMFVILLFPKLLEKVKIPGILGLVLGGVLIGPIGISLVHPDNETFHFVADVGKLMVMFFAGLEVNSKDFATTFRKSLTFGSLTFLIPLITGVLVATLAGYPILSATLIGSLLASHTLIALPILLKYKLMRNESVNVAIGATIFTDVAALIVLAVTVSIHTVGFSPSILLVRIGGMVIYFPLVLFGARAIAKFGNKIETSNENQTIIILLIMGVAAIGAEIIHLEGIVGAFIGGLAVSEVVREGEVRKSLDSLAHTLFIPMFFLAIGSMIDPSSFLRMSGADYLFAAGIVIGLVIAKLIAAKISARALNYSKNEGSLMWALSTPQLAATLAATLVAFESVNKSGERLINETVFDTILILMTVTAVLGPILAEIFSKRVAITDKK
jgi:Kef-type K+ transport system membrane component KefB